MGKLKFSIKNLLIENLLEQSSKFIKPEIDIPVYQKMLSGDLDSLPEKFRGYEVEVKYMTADEYLYEVAKLQGTSYEEQLKIIYQPNIKKILSNMSSGTVYNMGYLNYVDKDQEGRHRMVAASKLGGDKLPVLIITKSEENKGEGFTKVYDLSNHKSYMKFINLFDEDIHKIIDNYLYDEMSDGKYNINPNDETYYLSNLEFDSLPDNLTDIVKTELSKLDKETILGYYDEDEIDFSDNEFIYGLLNNVQPKLKNMFFYVNRLMYGVSNYMNEKRNFNILESSYDSVNFDFYGKKVKLTSQLDKNELKNFDFDFKYVYDIDKLNTEVSERWIKENKFK